MRNIIRKVTSVVIAVGCIVIMSSCASSKISMKSKELALMEIEKSILVLPPLTSDLSMLKSIDAMGTAFSSEIPKMINGEVVYAKNVRSLESSLNWKNLVRNGVINISECVTMGKTVGCSSVFACRVISFKKYPPFKMVVNLLWIDVETGDVLARAYNNLDMMDFETEQKFATFSGHGPVKRVYEEFSYKSDLKHSASLSPKKFCEYVAANSTQMLFGDLYEVPWYRFWQVL